MDKQTSHQDTPSPQASDTGAHGEPVAALAAVIQMNSGSDRAKNLHDAAALIEQAARAGARLVALPENFSFIGRSEADKREQGEDPHDGESLNFLKERAAHHGIWIIGGSVPLQVYDPAGNPDPDHVTNTCFVVDDGGSVRARYDKIHLFDVNLGRGGVFRESDVIQPGDRTVVVDTPFGRLGLSLCYDLRFPGHYRALVKQGATLISVPSAFTLATGKDHWELLLRARAVENFSFIMAPDQWGKHVGGQRTYGHSMIIEPWGTVTARVADGKGVGLALLDPARVISARRKIPSASSAGA